LIETVESFPAEISQRLKSSVNAGGQVSALAILVKGSGSVGHVGDF
jgi:hypothetical protein